VRLLKAKYYPVDDLIGTAFIHNCSPWSQGIMHGLELLKKGMIWRFMLGSKIKISPDNGLPRGRKLLAKLLCLERSGLTRLLKTRRRSWLREFSSQLMRM
jgi:hypothetical protein